MMVSQSWYVVGIFLACLISLPFVIKRYKIGQGMLGEGSQNQSKVVSAIAVGPQQKVLTVEVGQEGARVVLVLGVTAQQITCLHVIPTSGSRATGGVLEN